MITGFPWNARDLGSRLSLGLIFVATSVTERSATLASLSPDAAGRVANYLPISILWTLSVPRTWLTICTCS